jgi:hypothetical protein
LEIYYKETEEILLAKKDRLSQIEKELENELKKIKAEKDNL